MKIFNSRRISRTIFCKYNFALVVLFLCGLNVPGFALPSFPGAEGGGAESIGGRSGRIIEVTNLNASGSGSFKAACEASGARIVVFRVSGIIDLQWSDIYISNPYITIAGQTAPGGGILLKHGKLAIETNDVILRYIKVRTGWKNTTERVGGIGLYSDCYNVIVDHCSSSWTSGKQVDFWSDNLPSHHVTFSYNLLAEGLTHVQSCNLIIGSTESAASIHDISIHHNLMMSSWNRFPLVKSRDARIINNIIYNWAWFSTMVSGGVKVDIIGNKYKTGPSLDNSIYEVWARTDGSPGDGGDLGPIGYPSIYITGNYGPNQSNPNGDNWGMIVETKNGWQPQGHPPDKTKCERVSFLAESTPPITIHSVLVLEDLLLSDVGASKRLDENGKWISNRDTVDRRLIQEYKNGTGRIPVNENSVGSFPTIAPGTPYTDTDHDGMPNAWEAANGLNPNDDSDRNGTDLSSEGYTNVEVFINGIDKF